jgi:hypothetical protein
VGSSVASLLLLLDVRREREDVVDRLSPSLSGFRDRLSRSCPLLDELRDDREQSPYYRSRFRDDVEDASHCLKDSLHCLKDSLHHRKEASHRRFRPGSARKRLLPYVEVGVAYVSRERSSRFRLVAAVSRVKGDVKEVLQRRSGARSSRSKSRAHRECVLQYV